MNAIKRGYCDLLMNTIYIDDISIADARDILEQTAKAYAVEKLEEARVEMHKERLSTRHQTDAFFDNRIKELRGGNAS